MTARDIVRMANQISDFFKAYPEAVAVKETANHIRSFWDPRMRRELFDLLERGGEGLSPSVLAAAKALAEEARAKAAAGQRPGGGT